MFRKLPDAQLLRSEFLYRPDTGILIRRSTGKAIDRIGFKGYRKVTFVGKVWFAHRIIWKMVTGEDPKETIDHINHKQWDNRWENLRDVPMMENLANRRLRCVRALGERGVRKNGPTWRAEVSVQGRNRHLGSFRTKDEAVAAYQAAICVLGR